MKTVKNNAPPSGYVTVSPKIVKYVDGMFALTTRDAITYEGQKLKAGSYMIIDPSDKTLADGRLMLFALGVNCEPHLRVTERQGKRIILRSLAGNPPIVLHKDDFKPCCKGFVSMIIPAP